MELWQFGPRGSLHCILLAYLSVLLGLRPKVSFVRVMRDAGMVPQCPRVTRS